MLRSKRQALLFLSGAVLVGGVLGFSADRIVGHYTEKRDVQTRIERTDWMDALGATPDQRQGIEAILDSTNCRVLLLSVPLQPRIDSLRQAAREQWQNVLTAKQRGQLDDRRRQDSVRRADVAARRARGGGRAADGAGGPGRGRGMPGRGGRSGPISVQSCKALLKEQINP